jgi:hypothetical protein
MSQPDHPAATGVLQRFIAESFPAKPDLECDIVMKGGITSGVIYPLAVCELAQTYRLRSVGGASRSRRLAFARAQMVLRGRRRRPCYQAAGCDSAIGWRHQASCTGYPTKTKSPVALLRNTAIGVRTLFGEHLEVPIVDLASQLKAF